ncbi:hypothetical protein [Actinomadura litoris]|uniref:hypothetical protein n=1 Tax=Actinomadura litoris TaxID=2678616 RepID=UPI001FA7E0D5|nr:hypothetical protein [Actinomadura litoris]
MTSIKEASQLEGGNLIVRHPDRPSEVVQLRVTAPPRRAPHAQVIVNCWATSSTSNGPRGGAARTLILDVDQPCTVEIADGARKEAR